MARPGAAELAEFLLSKIPAAVAGIPITHLLGTFFALLVAVLVLLNLTIKRSLRFKSTAQLRAVMRFWQTLVDDPLMSAGDDLAQHFVPDSLRSVSRSSLMRPLVQRAFCKQLPGLYELTVASTRLWDQKVYELCRRNNIGGKRNTSIEQFVILGAGYDTRAYRFADLFKVQGIKVYEVDTEAAQKAKRSLLPKEVAAKANVAYVAADLTDVPNLAAALKQAGYSKDRLTLFLLEDVTAFLNEGHVRNLFTFIKENSAKGSMVFFDYTRRRALEMPDRAHGLLAFQRFATKQLKEERRFFALDETKIEQEVADLGLRLMEHYTSQQVQALARRSDGRLLGKIMNHVQFVIAENA